MKKALVVAVAAAAVALPVTQALAGTNHATTVKTVTVVMRDPGCHWFAVGGKFLRTLSVKGPVALANFDEATLKVAQGANVRLDAVGKKVVLARGSYRITMVGQARDDNTLTLLVR
jgi:hypothetical protein